VGIEAAPHFYKHAKLINELLGMGEIEIKKISAYDIDTTFGTFDVTLLLGVFYHLKNPFLLLDKLSEITRETIIIETAIRNSKEDIENRKKRKIGTPVMEFIEQPYRPKAYEGTWNWWAPNVECICAMLRSCGFSKTEVIDERILDHPMHPNAFGRAIVKGIK
jgi:hypothetical protein